MTSIDACSQINDKQKKEDECNADDHRNEEWQQGREEKLTMKPRRMA